MNEFVHAPLDNEDVNIHEDPNSEFVAPVGCTVSDAKDAETGEIFAEDAEIEEKVKKVVEKLRPYLQKDGGDMEYRGMDKKWVLIHMLGNCNGCGSVGMSLVEIEEFMIEAIGSADIKGISWV